MITIDQDSLVRDYIGTKVKIRGLLNYGLYQTGGSEITAFSVGLSQIEELEVDVMDGFLFEAVVSNPARDLVNLKVFSAGGFTGNALPTHTHQFSPVVTTVVAPPTIRIYLTGVVGVYTPGEIVTGSISTNTATVVSQGTFFATTFLVVTAPTGNFTAGDTITGGTSGATGLGIRQLINNWDLSAAFGFNSIVSTLTTNINSIVVQFPDSAAPIPGAWRWMGSGGERAVETDRSGGFTSITVSGFEENVSSTSAGTPSGTVSSGEVTNGFDLSILGPIPFEVIGL